MIPGHMGNYSFQLRYFFPDDIETGYLRYSSNVGLWGVLCSWMLQCCYQPKNEVESYIRCGAGSLTLSGRVVYVGSFAKQMHHVTGRQQSCDIISEFKDTECDTSLTDNEKKYIPMLSNETIIMRHRGGGRKHDFYQPNFQACCYNLCNRSTPCFPVLPYIFTCALRPFLAVSDYIVTDYTLYNIRAKFSLSSLICPWNEDDYQITWAPINHLKGSSLFMYIQGNETFCKRLWNCLCPCYLTRLCCNMSKTEYELMTVSHKSKPVKMTIDIELRNGKKWKDDIQLHKTQQLLSKVVSENMNRS